MTTENATANPPPGQATTLGEREGVAMLTAAMELQALARGRDPWVEAAAPAPEPLSRILAFGFAFSALLTIALVVEILTA